MSIEPEDIRLHNESAHLPSLSEALEENIAYGTNGTIYVARDAQNDGEVNQHLDGLRRAILSSEGEHPLAGFSQKTVPRKELVEAKRQRRSLVAQGSEASDELEQAMRLFETASRKNASDIHLRVLQDVGAIYFRINGDLHNIQQVQRNSLDQVIRVIYTRMTDIQDDTGFIESKIQDARVDDDRWLPDAVHSLRVVSLPTDAGHTMVIRLLYKGLTQQMDEIPGLSFLGYTERQIKCITRMKRQDKGINVIAGETGSGKSTSLKVILRQILEDRSQQDHILTVEDPPEYPIEGTTQVEVGETNSSEQRGESLNEAIRAALRSDPDIIMVGEVRDAETAELAIEAAQTGHQVWTTMHTNSAVGVVGRLIDLGIEPFKLASPDVLTGTMHQQLIPTLCSNCKVRFDPWGIDWSSTEIDPNQTLSESTYTSRDMVRLKEEGILDISYSDASVYRKGPGCEHCSGTGIEGRTLVAETFEPTMETMKYIRNENTQGLRDYWKEQNSRTTLDHAIEKIESGKLDPFVTAEELGTLLTRRRGRMKEVPA